MAQANTTERVLLKAIDECRELARREIAKEDQSDHSSRWNHILRFCSVALEAWHTDRSFEDLQASGGIGPPQPSPHRAQDTSTPDHLVDVKAIVERLGFDPTNHHNAVQCPYCTPEPHREQE